MKKILIIGKRGFIGNNLANYLKKFYAVKFIGFKDLTIGTYIASIFELSISSKTFSGHLGVLLAVKSSP